MKVAVVGMGGSGSAAARFLARDGHEVVGYERFELGHAMGSSHGHSRIIRHAYPDAFHTRLMARAYELWDELEQEHGPGLFVRCGGITFGPTGDPTLELTRRALEDAAIDFEILSRDETRSRFPAIDIGEGACSIYQAASGFLRSTRCVLAQVAIARAQGAEIHEHSRILRIEENAGQVFLSTAGETSRYDAVIVTAGPWIGKLMEPIHLPLRTALRQVVYLGIARRPENFEPEKLPVWIEHPSDYYGFPSDCVMAGIKIASHNAGTDFDPEEADRPMMPGPLEQVVAHAMKRFPDLSGDVISTQSCLYTITPDERFIVDFAPGSRRIVMVSGCIGHGFKFTPLLGSVAAAMATTGTRDPVFAPWRADRFNAG
ncbi:MAG: N-methyl-L-tryptophan oxidase [Luteolibacter sp.]|uniref:N-methyl-L-tryptophan oxidase n=1 Tax=Luteolibacter sp. TaxID=1962973 RepID=UPI0032656BE5